MGRPNKIKYPRAYRDGVQVLAAELTEADAARSRKSHRPYKCINPECPQPDMIVKGIGSFKKRPHFAHLNNECRISAETLTHYAAKEILKERLYIKLPPLYEDPLHTTSKELEPERVVHWRSVRDEQAILGRWRADIIMEGEHRDPTLIIDDGEPTPLVVEVVVTSAVSPAKIEAIQRAGWRLIAVMVDRGAEDPDLAGSVTYHAPRQWLAHPKWQSALDDARRRAKDKEQERLQAQQSYVDKIIKRIEAGTPPRWSPIRESELSTCISEHDLYNVVDIKSGYDHWMASTARWWHAYLINQAMIRPLRHGDNPVLPSTDFLLDIIQGFIIPLRNPRKALLQRLSITREQWGTPAHTVEAYVAALIESGLLVRTSRGVEASPELASRALRNQKIDTIVLSILHEDMRVVDARRALHTWRNQQVVDGMTRHQAIVKGGEEYALVLQQANQWRAAKRRLPFDHEPEDMERNPVKAPLSIVPTPQVPTTISPLDEVREIEQPVVVKQQVGVFDRNFSLPPIAAPRADRPTSGSETRGQRLPLRDVAKSPNKETRQNSAFTVFQKSADQWARDLEEVARGIYNQKGTRHRSKELASVFMNSPHPNLGGRRPVDVCVDQRTFDLCRNQIRGF